VILRAVGDQRDDLLSVLLDHGADPNLPADELPLSMAASFGTNESVRMLLEHGASPDGSVDERPIVDAATAGRADIVQVLLDAGGDLSLPAPWSARSTATLDVPVSAPSVGNRALAELAGDGDAASVQLLLARGVDPDEDPYQSPLLRAAAFGHAGVVQILLEAGADPNAPAATDPLSLHLTIDARVAAALGAQPLTTAPDDTSTTWAAPFPVPATSAEQDLEERWAELSGARLVVSPLHAAVAGRHPATVAMLLAAGADPNAVALDRYRPLDVAAVTCDVDAARALLDAGAAPAFTADPAINPCPEVAALVGT
jgi:ankyrin repeat protein